MSEIPSYNPENEETLEKELLQLLKEKGVEDLEARKALIEWTKKQEEKVERSEDYFGAQIKLNIRRAWLYYEAGYTDAAYENFEAALIQASQGRREEMCQQILNEMDKKGL